MALTEDHIKLNKETNDGKQNLDEAKPYSEEHGNIVDSHSQGNYDAKGVNTSSQTSETQQGDDIPRLKKPTSSLSKCKKGWKWAVMLLAILLVSAIVLWISFKKNAPSQTNRHDKLTSKMLPSGAEYDTVVCSDDGIIRCYGLSQSNKSEIPMMIIQYTTNGEDHWVEEMGRAEECNLCLRPEIIYHISAKNSTIYLVYGYSGYTGNGYDYCIKAYRLDDGVLELASVFDGFENSESIYKEILSEDLSSKDEIFYYNSNDSSIYIKESDGFLKYAWNGEKFMKK